ncbi:MAG: hypothetical protein WC070_04815 [Candidatus Magasanikbacteria bacterium]
MSRFVLNQVLKIKNLLSKILPKKLSKYHYLAFFVSSIILVFIFSSHSVIAEGSTDVFGGIGNWVSGALLTFANLAILLSIFFLKFFIHLASYNNYIDVNVVKIGWVMVRDVANMFFVVALLIIAFATILGIEKYEWKKGLVKLIAMAILINFSNLIAQVIIDVAHVFTITFLNAISASAGGNLINMFDLAEINTMVHGRELGSDMQQANYAIFGAAVLALIFSVITAVTLGAYAIVMAARVVVLWALIILSPLAYLLSALPDGDKYASKWWSEFNRHVIVAPVMVFFLWLAFATFGSGNIMAEISKSATVPLDTGSIPTSISLLEVSTWENMASFILGIIFLVIGLKMTQETGATASGMVSAAVDWGKKVATIASGYALGRWMVGKGKDAVIENTPIVGMRSLRRYGKQIKGVTTYPFKRFAIARDGQVQNLEKKREDAKKEGKTFKSFALGAAVLGATALWSSSKRKDTLADNWEDIAEHMDREHEAKISTSRTPSGDLKQTARVRADFAVEAKDTKGPQKGAERALKLIKENDKSVVDSLKAMSSSKSKGEVVTGLVDEVKREKYLKERDKDQILDKKTDDDTYMKILARKKVFNEKFQETVDTDRDLMQEDTRLHLHDTDDNYKNLDNRSTEAGERLTQAKNLYAKRMDEGSAVEKAKLMEDDKFKKREQEFGTLEARTKAITEDVNSQKELYLLKAIKEILGEITLDTKGNMTGPEDNVYRRSFVSKAAVERLKDGVERTQISSLASARAEGYEKESDDLRANSVRKNAAAEIQKRDTEMFANLSYQDRRLLEQTLIVKIQEAEDKGDTDLLKKLRMQKNSLTTLNMLDDAETSRDTRIDALDKLGINELGDKNRLKAELQRRLGVHTTKLEAVSMDEGEQIAYLQKLFDDLYEGQEVQKQIVLEQIEKAMKSVAMKGDEYGLGLINSTPSSDDIASGTITRSWKSKADNDETDYFATRARGVDSIEGYAKLKKIGDKYKINGFSKRGVNSVSFFFKGVDSRSMAAESMKSVSSSVNEASVDSSNVDEYLDFLEKTKSLMQSSGYETAKKQWEPFIEKLEAEADFKQKERLKEILKKKED